VDNLSGINSERLNSMAIREALSREPIFHVSPDPKHEPQRMSRPYGARDIEWHLHGSVNMPSMNRGPVIDAVVEALKDWRELREGHISGRIKKPVAANKLSKEETDKAIRTEMVKHHETITRAEKGDKGAKKAMKDLFGLSRLANRINAHKTTVSRSAVWCDLAEEHGLRRTKATASPRATKIGGDIALEEKPVPSTDDLAIHNEDQKSARQKIIAELKAVKAGASGEEREGIDDLCDRVSRGEVDTEDAREMLKLLKSQRADDTSKRVLGEM